MGTKTIVTCDRCNKEWEAKKSIKHYNGLFGRPPLYLCDNCSDLYRDLLSRLDKLKHSLIGRFKQGEMPEDLCS